jgi:hypothetical protein
MNPKKGAEVGQVSYDTVAVMLRSLLGLSAVLAGGSLLEALSHGRV